MSFVSGRADLAEVYLQEALETDSSYEESHLFLGFVRFSTGDAAGALAELEPLLASEDVPEDLREELQATGRRRPRRPRSRTSAMTKTARYALSSGWP